MKFDQWLDTLLSEKGIDLERIIDVEGPSGLNAIPVGCLVDAIKATTTSEQTDIKTMIVWIDFVNRDVFDYLKHLARAIAI